ncbi:ABC-type amino acid transport system, permease component [Halapricum desulfuricans]|uniref:ABC-type amino acid transport system, permease component n=1 Tax=Halapricum desulfuricans TaxID=2841257 RepID=A0A897NCR4_9EURY|nr:amino acid ABC transporter permease [Halapricum desulfuricans]QSG12200.1 ABC-type amino acid transport system, permease component [Halapricum desulfuricans]
MSVDETEPAAVGDLPGRRRAVVLAVGAVFWAWLLARWAYHNAVLDGIFGALGAPDLIRSEVAVMSREPWLSPAPLESAADSVASSGLPEVATGWPVWLLDLAAFAVESAPALAEGAYVTVYLTIASMLLGLVVAVPLAVARVYGGATLSRLSLAYTELIRGTPLLAQLFLLYYGLPITGVVGSIGLVGSGSIPGAAVFVAILGFTINSSAYQSEYIRSALQSVDDDQLVAARSVGLSKWGGIRHVVLPQGLRYAIPGWTNEFVYLIKYSALAAFITVPELFGRAEIIGSDTFRITDIYVIVAVFYLALVLTAALAMKRVSAAVAIPGVGQHEGDR